MGDGGFPFFRRGFWSVITTLTGMWGDADWGLAASLPGHSFKKGLQHQKF